MKGYVHSFESLAAVDGDGLRCAVFLAGCPLRCIYCHNPDTWERNASEWDAQALVKKIIRYKPYFKDDGGVTFSGGEPLVQAEFIRELVPLLDDEKVNYAIDTSGAVELTESVKYVLEKSQMVLLDLKFWDDESYLKYTGQSIGNTLATLRYLNEIGKRCVVRTVIVPGINDSEEVLLKYLEHIRNMRCVEKYELLAFHTMGFFKYEKSGIKNRLEGVPALDMDVKMRLQKFVDCEMKKF